jgi:WD40 repeat protein
MKNKNSFRGGPISDLQLTPEHGGPVLCMDVRNDIVVTGSTDHGLRVYSLSTGKQIKELFSKNYGHTEWVTCCKILDDSRVISGGMDSNICIWDAKGVKCKFMKEHTGSISKIIVDTNHIVLSSSYDSSIRIWDANSNNSLGILQGVHKGPITEFSWVNSLCVSGGRDGSLCIWDINTQQSIFFKTLHGGNVNKIKLHSSQDSNLIITSGVNDGLVNCLDMRSPHCIVSNRIHKGAINLLETSGNFLLSGSSDKTIKICDISNNLKEVSSMKTTDSILCGELFEDLIFVGCQDGNMLCYDINIGDCLFGYGCESQGGVKNLRLVPEYNKIITSGDSGQSLQLIF